MSSPSTSSPCAGIQTSLTLCWPGRCLRLASSIHSPFFNSETKGDSPFSNFHHFLRAVCLFVCLFGVIFCQSICFASSVPVNFFGFSARSHSTPLKPQPQPQIQRTGVQAGVDSAKAETDDAAGGDGSGGDVGVCVYVCVCVGMCVIQSATSAAFTCEHVHECRSCHHKGFAAHHVRAFPQS